MANYVDLKDPVTGQKVDVSQMAKDYILFHNDGHNDGLVVRAINSVPDNASPSAAIEKLYGDFLKTVKEKHLSGYALYRDPAVAPTLDAMAYYYLEARLKAAQDKGEARFDLSYNVDGLASSARSAGAASYDRTQQTDLIRQRLEDRVARKQAETDRLAKRTPIEEAAEKIVGNHTSDNYKAVVRLANEATSGGVTTDAAMTRLLNKDNYSQHIWGDGWRNKAAREVVQEASHITEERQAAAAQVRQHPAKPAATKPASAASYLDQALNEIVGTSGKGLMNPVRTDHDAMRQAVRQFVNDNKALFNAPQAQRDEMYASLLDQYQQRQGDTESVAASYAMGVFRRAVELKKAHDRGQPLPPLTRDSYLAQWATDEQYVKGTQAWKTLRPDAAGAGADAGGAGAAAGAGGSASASSATIASGLTPDQIKQIQFDLESLGAGYDTGQPGGFDASKLAAGMDGVAGSKTRPSMEKFLKDNNLGTEFNEAAIAKLHALAEAKRAAAPAAPAQPGAAAPAAAPDLKTQLATQITAAKTETDAATCLTDILAQQTQLMTALQNSGLTPDKLDALKNATKVDILGGCATNDYLTAIETALGLKVDGQLDSQLTKLLKDPVASRAIAAAINAGQIVPLATPATGAGAQPGR